MVIYDLELDNLIEKIREKGHKIVLIQLPDGLKPEAKNIVDTIREKTDAEALIWLGTCFGACDIPFGLLQLNVDFLVQFGHNVFRKKEGW